MVATPPLTQRPNIGNTLTNALKRVVLHLIYYVYTFKRPDRIGSSETFCYYMKKGETLCWFWLEEMLFSFKEQTFGIHKSNGKLLWQNWYLANREMYITFQDNLKPSYGHGNFWHWNVQNGIMRETMIKLCRYWILIKHTLNTRLSLLKAFTFLCSDILESKTVNYLLIKIYYFIYVLVI